MDEIPIEYVISVDLGQAQDYTAIAVIERRQKKASSDPIYKLRHVERAPLGTNYETVVDRVAQIITSDQIAHGLNYLVLDMTGVGVPIFDMFDNRGLQPIGIHIHGGDNVSRDGRKFRVPKRDLVGAVQVLLQNGRFKMSPHLELYQELFNELTNFKMKIDPKTAHDSYAAWREADHDDLVLSVAMGLWWLEKRNRPIMFDSMPVDEETGLGYQGLVA